MKRKQGNFFDATPTQYNNKKSGGHLSRTLQSVGKLANSGVGRLLFKKAHDSVRKRFSKSTDKRNVRVSVTGIGNHNDMREVKPKTIMVGKKKSMKTLGQYHLTHVHQAVFEGTQGKQGVNNIIETLNLKQLNGVTTTSDSGYAAQWGTDPFVLNPYSTAPQNTIYSATAALKEPGDRIMVKSIDQKIDFVNLTVHSTKIDIYYCLCTNTADALAPTGAWLQHFQQTKYLQPTAASAPTTVAANPVVGYASFDVQGTIPTNKTLSKFWKIIHKRSIILGGGDSVKTRTKFILNKMYVYNELANAYSTGSQYLAGTTIIPMIVQNGSLIGFQADDVTTGKAVQVGFSKTKIGCLVSDHITFAALPAPRFTIKRMELGTLAGSSNAVSYLNDEDAHLQVEVSA